MPYEVSDTPERNVNALRASEESWHADKRG